MNVATTNIPVPPGLTPDQKAAYASWQEAETFWQQVETQLAATALNDPTRIFFNIQSANARKDADYKKTAFEIAIGIGRRLGANAPPFTPPKTPADYYQIWQSAIALKQSPVIIASLKKQYDAAVAAAAAGAQPTTTASPPPPTSPVGIPAGGTTTAPAGTQAPAGTPATTTEPGMVTKLGTALLLTAPAWGAWLYLRSR